VLERGAKKRMTLYGLSSEVLERAREIESQMEKRHSSFSGLGTVIFFFPQVLWADDLMIQVSEGSRYTIERFKRSVGRLAAC
jgi:hypothetical protein